MVHASVQESLAELRRFPASLPWALGEQSVESAEAFCVWSEARYRSREALTFLVLHRETRSHVGNIGLSDFEWDVAQSEIGFWGRTGLSGQGFITEAVRGLTEFAFRLGVGRVYALPDAENIPSCRVCERAGFKLEGTTRQNHPAPGGCANIYSKLAQGKLR